MMIGAALGVAASLGSGFTVPVMTAPVPDAGRVVVAQATVGSGPVLGFDPCPARGPSVRLRAWVVPASGQAVRRAVCLSGSASVLSLLPARVWAGLRSWVVTVVPAAGRLWVAVGQTGGGPAPAPALRSAEARAMVGGGVRSACWSVVRSNALLTVSRSWWPRLVHRCEQAYIPRAS